MDGWEGVRGIRPRPLSLCRDTTADMTAARTRLFSVPQPTPKQKFPCNHHLSSRRVRAAAAHVVSCGRSENISWLRSQVCRLRIIWHPRVVSCTNQCMYILYSCNLHYMNSFVAGSFVQDRHFLKKLDETMHMYNTQHNICLKLFCII
jgi:hypothetical protein